MKKFILDCSVTMGWCFEDQITPYTEQVLESLSHSAALVPELWYAEVANVLLVAERRKKITPADSTKFLSLLSELPISTLEMKEEKLSNAMMALGRLYSLSAYDALYLHLAMSHDLSLATRDDHLRNACKKAGVEIFSYPG